MLLRLILFLITTVGFCEPSHANALDTTIQWLSWKEAVVKNKTMPKKIFIDVYTEWCGWCKKMDASTFLDTNIVHYINEHYYAVKFDAEQSDTIRYDGQDFVLRKNGRKGIHELAEALLDGKLTYPSYVFLTSDFERIMISQGYKSVDMLAKELKFAQEDIYAKSTWEAYEKSGK